MNYPKKKDHIKLIDKQGKDYRAVKDWIKFGYNQCHDDFSAYLQETLCNKCKEKIKE